MARYSEPHVLALAAVAERIGKSLSKAGHTAAHDLHAEVRRLLAAAEALRDLHATRNPTETDGAHTKRVATSAAKFSASIVASRERLHDLLRAGLNDIEHRTGEKVRLTPDAYAAEIRAALRTMPHTDRLKLLTELVEANRGPELAAIVRAPAILTGISKDLQDRYAAAILTRHAPEEQAEQAALMETFNNSLTAASTAATVATAYSDPAKLAEIAKAEAAAATAANAFDAAVGAGA